MRTVERELLLRCSSDVEAETWRKALISSSSASLSSQGSSQVFGGSDAVIVSSFSGSFSKSASESLLAEDGDALDETGVSMSHRIMTVGSAESTKSSFSGGSSAGAIPGWDGKKNSIGCVQAPVLCCCSGLLIVAWCCAVLARHSASASDSSASPARPQCFGTLSNLVQYFCPRSGFTRTSTAFASPTTSSLDGTSRFARTHLACPAAPPLLCCCTKL